MFKCFLFLESPPWARFSWTSGKFSNKFGKTESFTFEATGETWSHEDRTSHFSWVDEKFILNPTDEICMLIVNGTTSSRARIRPVVCDIRNYFICYKDIEQPEQPCAAKKLRNPELTNITTKFIRTGANSKYLYPERMILIEPQKALDICAELKLQPASIQTLADFQHIWDLINKKDFVKKFGVDAESVFSVSISGSARDKPGIYLTTDEQLLPFQLFAMSNFYYYVSKFLAVI